MTYLKITKYPKSDGNLYAPGPGETALILVNSLLALVKTVDFVSANFEQ